MIATRHSFRRTGASACLALAVMLCVPSARAADDDASRFPDAPAVIVESKTKWTVINRRKIVGRVHRTIRIQDRRGFDVADQAVVYDAFNEHVREFRARTVLPDGTTIELPEDLMRDEVLFKAEGIELRRLQFTFPRVAVGATLEWSYARYVQDRIPEFDWEPQGDLPVERATYHLVVETPFSRYATIHFAPEAVDDSRCTLESGGWKRPSLDVTCRDLDVVPDEPAAPPRPDRSLRWDVDLVPSDEPGPWSLWAFRFEREWALLGSFLADRDRIEALAREIAGTEDGVTSKLNAVFAWVRSNVEPAAAGGRHPDVGALLDAGTASPWEETALVLGLLDALDVPVRPVLLNDRTRRAFDVRRDPFDQAEHLALQADIGGRAVILDPGCRLCSTSTPDWRYCDEEPTGIAMDANQRQVVTVGEVAARFNGEDRVETYRLDSDGTASLEGRIRYGEQFDLYVRRRWASMTGAGRVRDFETSLPAVRENADIRFSDLDDPLVPVEVVYEVHGFEIPRIDRDRWLLLPTGPVASHFEIPLVDERATEVRLPFRHVQQVRTRFELPPDVRVARLPELARSSSAGLDFIGFWKADDQQGVLEWSARLIVDRTSIPADRYGEARGVVLDMRRALRDGVVLERRATSAGGEP